MKRIILILVISLSLIPSKTIAAGMLTYDLANHIEQIMNNMENYLIEANTKINSIKAIEMTRNQLKQLEAAKNRFMQLKRQADALTGKYGYGRWFKGPARLMFNEYRPETEEEWTRLLREGKGSDKYAKSRDAWVNIYNPRNPLEKRYYKEDTPETSQERDLIDSTGKLYVFSKYLYEETVERTKTIDKIMKDADDAETMKQSLDVLNVNVAELHRTIEKLLTLQTIIAEKEGIMNQEQVNDNTKAAEFSKWD